MKARPIFVLSLSLALLGFGLLLKFETGQTVETKPGEVAGSQIDALSTLAPDLPLYPEAELVSLLQKDTGFELTLESKSSPEPLQRFYENGLRQNGWESPAKQQFTKSGKELNLQLIASPDQTQTIVIINYTGLVPTK